MRRAQEENEAELDDLRRGLNECAEDLEKETQRTRASESRELQLKAQFQKVLQQLDTDQLQRCARLLHTPTGVGGTEFDGVDAYNDDEDGVYEEVDDSGVEPEYGGDGIIDGANISASYRPGSLSFSQSAEAFVTSPPLVAPPPPPPPGDLTYSSTDRS